MTRLRYTCAEGGVGTPFDQGSGGRRCPYREHALQTPDEHDAWDVLMACQGPAARRALGTRPRARPGRRPRACPGGRVYDEAAMAELLPHAEWGLVTALNERDKRDGH